VCSRGGVAPQPVVGGAGGDIAGLRYPSPEGAPPLEKKNPSDVGHLVTENYCNSSYKLLQSFVFVWTDMCLRGTDPGSMYRCYRSGYNVPEHGERTHESYEQARLSSNLAMVGWTVFTSRVS
jgi:hypothetical protein